MTLAAPAVSQSPEDLLAAAGESIADNFGRWLRFIGHEDGQPFELQALDIPGNYVRSRFAHVTNLADAARLLEQAEKWNAPGLYVVVNRIDAAVATRADVGKWHDAKKGDSTTDRDIVARVAAFVDVDAKRPRGTSATDEQVALTAQAATRVHERLARELGEAALGYGHSGNGRSVFVALAAIAESTEIEGTIKGILAALGALFLTPRVEIDRSVTDAKRLGPAWGTTKHKGAAGVAERPHRRTAFVCHDEVRRIDLDELGRLLASLRAELTLEQQAEVDRAMGVKPKAATPASRPTPAPKRETPFTRANAVPVGDVLEWLGLVDADGVRCPGCGATGDTSVAIVGNGVKCLHASCSSKGGPGVPGFRSVVDLVVEARGGSGRDAVTMLADRFGFEGFRRRRREDTPEAARDDDDRPVVRVGVDLHRVVDEAVALLGEDLELYQRDGELVRVVRTAEPEADALTLAGTPTIRRVAAATLCERLTRASRWEKFDKRCDEWVPSVPPAAVVQAVAARGEFPGVRPVVGIAEAPMLRPDGSVLEQSGYDPTTGYVYVPGAEFPAVPARPTQGDAQRALGELAEVFCDFPYAREADRVLPIAAVLTLLARPAIRGSVPAFVFDANVRGSGKTKQTDAVSLIATGRETAKMNYPSDDAELEKVLGSYALRGAAMIAFDNVVGRFGGGPLDRVLTAGDAVELRVLGKSEVPSLRWRALVLATGNNVEVVGDTTRRVLLCRLESPLERPEDRAGFRHPNLLRWVHAERARLVVAALTILRAWVLAGRPACDARSWGSFEAWAAIVPPALLFAGAADPMACRLTDGAEDPEHRALLAILAHWPRLAPEGAGAKGAVEALYSADRLRGQAPPDGFEELREAIEALVPTVPGRAPSTAKLGYALRRFRRRVVAGARLDTVAGHAGTVRWVVRAVRTDGGDGGDGGDVPNPSRGNWQGAGEPFSGLGAETSPPSPPSPPDADDVEREAIAAEEWA